LESKRILEADSKDFESSFFMLDGIRLFAMPDVAFIDEGGGVQIVDWKTGSPSDANMEQVVGYALFIEARHGFSALGTRVSLVYLNQKVEEAFVIDEAAVQKFRVFFKTSTAAMQAKLLDMPSNTALGENHFLKTEMSGRCELCPFLKICSE
jgi:RecB family exonuclease